MKTEDVKTEEFFWAVNDKKETKKNIFLVCDIFLRLFFNEQRIEKKYYIHVILVSSEK